MRDAATRLSRPFVTRDRLQRFSVGRLFGRSSPPSITRPLRSAIFSVGRLFGRSCFRSLVFLVARKLAETAHSSTRGPRLVHLGRQGQVRCMQPIYAQRCIRGRTGFPYVGQPHNFSKGQFHSQDPQYLCKSLCSTSLTRHHVTAIEVISRRWASFTLFSSNSSPTPMPRKFKMYEFKFPRRTLKSLRFAI